MDLTIRETEIRETVAVGLSHAMSLICIKVDIQ
jgi:hypothetical protein